MKNLLLLASILMVQNVVAQDLLSRYVGDTSNDIVYGVGSNESKVSINEQALQDYKLRAQHHLLSSPVVATSKKNILPHIYMLPLNGINTNYQQALQNQIKLEKISQVSGTTVAGSDYVIWDYLYNPTGTSSDNVFLDAMHGTINFFENIVDVGWQKFYDTDHSRLTYMEYLKGYMQSQGIPLTEKEIEKYSGNPKIRERYADFIRHRGGFNTGYIIDEFNHKIPLKFAAVSQLLKSGNISNNDLDYGKSNDAVVLIPHSQGNLYANSLYLYLTQVENFNSVHIAIFGIASPADINYGGWWSFFNYKFDKYLPEKYQAESYITSCSDRVIEVSRGENGVANILQLIKGIFTFNLGSFSHVAECNADVSPGGSDLLNHNLVDYYLKQPELKQKIILGINEAAFIVDNKLMSSMVYNMVPYNNSDYPYNFYPQVYALVFGYNSYVSQYLGLYKIDSYGKPSFDTIWSKNWGVLYDEENHNQLIMLKTPLLDQQIAQFPDDSRGEFRPALTHLAALPSMYYVDGGYDPSEKYYVFEDINRMPQSHRIIFFPHNEWLELNGKHIYYTYEHATYTDLTFDEETNKLVECSLLTAPARWHFLSQASVSALGTDIDKDPKYAMEMNSLNKARNASQRWIGQCIKLNPDIKISNYAVIDGYFLNPFPDTGKR